MEKSDSPEIKSILEELRLLKDRLSIVEASLANQNSPNPPPAKEEILPVEEDFDLKLPFRFRGSIESRVGEYGMAWMGNIVLLFGITFLVRYLDNSGYDIFSTLAGFVSVAIVYAGSFLTRTSYSYISRLFSYNGHLLLYYMALQLHFFQDNPLIKSKITGLLILTIVLAALFYLSLRQKSQLLSGMVLFMMLFTGVISNSAHLLAGTAFLTALIAVILYYRFGWARLVFLYIFLIYLTHLTWLLNNPFMGNNAEFIQSPGIGYFFIFATGAVFSLLAVLPKKENISDDFIITSIIFNGLGFTAILALTVVTYLSTNYVPMFSSIAVFCIVWSFILQSRSFLKITASMYAIYGFLALSVAFYGIFGLPRAYMLFSLQSLLVVSMALWFRSRFIVVMNTILFLILMIVYLRDTASYNGTNFSFMLVAFLTARVINWKKERLNIKTELLRNLYLVAGFIMTLIAFYQAFPEHYITASWILAAILFFIMSLLLKNFKYRWLAIATMAATGIKLIFIDMSNIDIGYRVLVFLMLAIISITTSILYTKYFMKKKE